MRTSAVLTLSLGTPLLVVGGLLAAFTLYDPRVELHPADFLPRTAWERSLMPHAHEATAEVCHELPCVEAITSDTVTVMKFPSQGLAAEVADRYGDDAHQSAWMVIRYEGGGLTSTRRTELENWIDCTNTWVGAGGQDC